MHRFSQFQNRSSSNTCLRVSELLSAGPFAEGRARSASLILLSFLRFFSGVLEALRATGLVLLAHIEERLRRQESRIRQMELTTQRTVSQSSSLPVLAESRVLAESLRVTRVRRSRGN